MPPALSNSLENREPWTGNRERLQKNVYLSPSGEKLEFRREAGYVKVAIPEVSGYQMVVFE